MIRKNIPNFVTLFNLLSGSISIVFAFGNDLVMAAIFIGLAAIFDFLDGMMARLLNARSPIGLQLDSLADVISFGLAPGFIVYHLMTEAMNTPMVFVNDFNVALLPAFLIPAFSALRLAKFNIDDRQLDSFIGLPTPANALFFASLPLVAHQAALSHQIIITGLLNSYWVLLSITMFFCYLLVSPLPLMAFKFKTISLKENLPRYLFLASAIVLFFLLKYHALPLIILLYLVISVALSKIKG